MSWVFIVRALLLTLLLVSASSTVAQTIPVEKQPFEPIPFLAPRRSQLTAWQIAEWSAHVTKCVRSYGPTRNSVTVSVTIGPDGMIIGDPEIASPIDSDEFREDVKNVVKKLHQCEPFIVDPFGRDKGPFTQPFNFPPLGFDPEMLATVAEHFKKCWRRPKTGPDVTVELKYKPNGKFAELPHPLNQENTTAYSRAAAEVINQLSKCPPLAFAHDKYSQVQRFTWTFMTIESAAAYESKTGLK
jgi:hypothetical protein